MVNTIAFVFFESNHPKRGATHRIQRQYEAMKRHHTVTAFFRPYYWFLPLKILVNPLFYEWMVVIKLLFSKKSVVYYRFNYRAIVFNLFIWLFRKHILYLELNGNNHLEALHRGGPLRRRLNTYFEYRLVRRSEKVIANIFPLSDPINHIVRTKLELVLTGAEKTDEPFEDLTALARVQEKRRDYRYLAIIAGEQLPEMGLDRIFDLLQEFDRVCLIIAGNRNDVMRETMEEQFPGHHALWLDGLAINQLGPIFELCNFAFGPFAMDRLGLELAAPPIVSTYMLHGLPVVLNTPMVKIDQYDFVHVFENEAKFAGFLDQIPMFNRTEIEQTAEHEFSWDTIMKFILADTIDPL